MKMSMQQDNKNSQPAIWFAQAKMSFQSARGRRGFTVIELLVVIAIIALLAGLVIGAFAMVNEKKIRSRVRAELAALQTVIQSYHEKKGFFPPSNGDVNNSATNQLFYELTGTSLTNGTFYPLAGGQPLIAAADVKTFFGTDGFVNSNSEDTKDYFSNLKPGMVKSIPGTDVKVLVVPVKGPGGDFNPWHYDAASNKRHNSDSYDLWADVVIGSKVHTIGNWKD